MLKKQLGVIPATLIVSTEADGVRILIREICGRYTLVSHDLRALKFRSRTNCIKPRSGCALRSTLIGWAMSYETGTKSLPQPPHLNVFCTPPFHLILERTKHKM